MTLRQFLDDFQTNKGPHDFAQIYHEGRNGHISTISLDLDRLTAEARELLLDTDLIRAEIVETDYCDPFQPGRGGKCLCWKMQLNNDQAMIALGIHPALNKAGATKAKRGKSHRFTLR